LKIGYVGSLKWKKYLQMAVLSHTFIYLYIKLSYIIPYMYLTTGGKIKNKKGIVKLQSENVYPKGQSDPDNQRPDKWCSTVQ
jgi:hypothetical protein